MDKIVVFVLVFSLTAFLMFGLAFAAFAERQAEPHPLKISVGARHDLQERLGAYVAAGQVANLSFGLWQNGKLIVEGDYGPVGEQQSARASDTTIYRIRSMTKPVTAIGLLILMERGHFKLSDPITKFLPEFDATETLADADQDGTLYTYRAIQKPTMGQLLSHTAGLAYWQPSGGIIDERMLAAGVPAAADTDQLVEDISAYPYIAAPGAEWNYSLASDLQGAIIERISGRTLADFLEQEIFAPLGMHDTGFHVPENHLHRISDITARAEHGAQYRPSAPATLAAQSAVYSEGGHGLFSTRRDYFLFLTALLNQKSIDPPALLSAKTLENFRTNAIRYRDRPGRQRVYGAGAGLGFGLGVGTIEDPAVANMAAPKGTFYWHGALGTCFWVDPLNDTIFIAMLQSESALDPEIMRTAMAAIYGRPQASDRSAPVIVPAFVHASEGSG
ncbi:MAG: serine hydrolase domain-containing protein [Pseudomonadota bacterium]